jgi:hypothetical protein
MRGSGGLLGAGLAGPPILSLYLNLDPSRSPTPRERDAQLSALLDQAEQHVGLAGELFGDRPEGRAAVGRLGPEVAGRSRRTVAHGLYPPLLASRGSPEALRALAATGPTTVYFCCLEALQHATKHAGDGASVDICLDARDAEVRFSVRDNGAGLDPGTVQRGAGLAHIAERVAAAGGTLSIHSSAGRGTHAEGLLQC